MGKRGGREEIREEVSDEGRGREKGKRQRSKEGEGDKRRV